MIAKPERQNKQFYLDWRNDCKPRKDKQNNSSSFNKKFAKQEKTKQLFLLQRNNFKTGEDKTTLPPSAK